MSKTAVPVKASFLTQRISSSDFETNALIYLSSHDQWYPRSSCLWTDQTIIPGKAAIKLEYPQLSEFFLKKLGIKKPSLGKCSRPSLLYQYDSVSRYSGNSAEGSEAFNGLQYFTCTFPRGFDLLLTYTWEVSSRVIVELHIGS